METMTRTEATPPTIVTAEDLLKRLRAGTKESYKITMRDLTIPVRILTIDEMSAIRLDSIKQSAMVGGDETVKAVAMQKTVLKMASTITKGGGPMLSDNLLSMLSVDEINFLYEEYVKVLDDANPMLERMSEAQFRALVDAVKKNSVSSKDLSLSQLRAIFTAYQDLIQRQETQKSPTVNSSGGQQ